MATKTTVLSPATKAKIVSIGNVNAMAWDYESSGLNQESKALKELLDCFLIRDTRILRDEQGDEIGKEHTMLERILPEWYAAIHRADTAEAISAAMAKAKTAKGKESAANKIEQRWHAQAFALCQTVAEQTIHRLMHQAATAADRRVGMATREALGGREAMVMLGADVTRQQMIPYIAGFCNGGFSVKYGRGLTAHNESDACTVILTPRDEYRLYFWRDTKNGVKLLEVFECYADNLSSLFESRTALYLTMPRIRMVG